MLDEYVEIQVHSNALKRKVFTVQYSTVVENSDEWMQHATDSVVECF